MTRKKTIALVILDGFGMSEKTEGNAIAGNAPFFDFLTKQYPFCTLSASGADVGCRADKWETARSDISISARAGLFFRIYRE